MKLYKWQLEILEAILMLSRQEFFSRMRVGTNSDGTPMYPYNKTARNDLYKDYVKKETMNSVPCTSASTPVTVSTDNYCVGTISSGQVYQTNSFYDLAKYVCPSYGSLDTTVSPYSYGIKQEGNNPMNYATATVQAGTTETQDQRKYLTRRLEDTFYEKERPLYAQFGLTDDDAPVSPKELKKRLEDGKFIIKGIPDDEDDEDEDQYFYGGWVQMIRWRDPAKKADQDGYNAARKELKAKYQEALDTIKIDEPKAGLDAIKALEAWTPTGAAN